MWKDTGVLPVISLVSREAPPLSHKTEVTFELPWLRSVVSAP